ncbi:MAG TPA: TonB-dependent receptor, partial [Bacteroidia bacterium]|nr:TonB-dependent receptor [Bacteroidia bacterium]
MHFKKGFFLSLCLLYSFVSFSQISGRVLSNTGQSIPFCNVVLITAADSALVTGTTTDSAGLFQLEIKRPGTFLIRVVYMGYNEKYSKSIAIGTGLNQFDAGNLVLSPNAQMLKGVQVTAEKPFMEHQLDRIVYNIENSIISAGNNGLEVLKKLPGVTVDNDVSIKVRGKPGVMIMVDGRTSYLSAADVANYLKSLDASQIEKIEVITNPSSRYDASGNAVINIILKKDKNLGFNAQVTSSFRLSDENHGGFANIVANYRTRKLNFFGTYNFASGANSSWLDNKNIFTAPGIPASTFADHSVSRMDGVYNYGRFGIDYTPDKRQTIGILGEGFNANETRQLSDLTSIYNERPAPDSSFSRNGSGAMMGKRVTVNLNYTFKIDSAGKELSANADYGWFSNSFNELDRTTYSPGSSLYSQPALLKYTIPGELRIKAFKVDYAQPFGKNTKLELGAKMSQVNSDNNSQYWNVMPGGDVLDTVKTNHFAFTENINAAYFNLSRKFSEKVEAQAGLRGEETQTNGLLFQTNTSTSRKYQNLFPSAFVSWKIDSSHTLNASYSRR